MKKKYFVQNDSDNTVCVYLEDESGFEFICECGDVKSEGAHKNAELICDLLNKALPDD